MKRCTILISILLSILPILAQGGWQVASPRNVAPQEPFFPVSTENHPSMYASDSYPDRFANLGRPAPIYAISVCGSLKENLERIMHRYHWRVVWKAPYDFNFDGRVTGPNLPKVVEKLLQPFPLEATMYMSNRTLMVSPRKL